MLLTRLDRRSATLVRLVVLVLIGWSVFHADHPPSGHGRGLVIALLFAAAVGSWLVWTVRPLDADTITPDLWVMAGAGGLLTGASPDSAAGAFVFVAVVTAGVRVELRDAVPVAAVGVVSEATVKTHINHMFAKVGARDRAQAVHYAYTRGLAK